MKRAHLLPALAAIAACLAALAGVTAAYASGHASATRSKPAGYTVVSKQFAATPGVESDGSVVCPKATVPLGGSVFVRSSPQLRVNVSASFPFGGFWAGSVKNSSDTASTFAVVAVCAHRPTGYRVVHSAMVANPAFTQSRAAVTCPAGTMPLGGGGVTSSSSTDNNMNGTAPSGRSWTVTQNNAGTTDATITAVAVCGKVRGYKVVKGKPFPIDSGSQGGSFAACPAPTVPISGGVISGSKNVFVDFVGSFPAGNKWDSFVNNSTEGPITSTAVAVCASR